MKPQTGRVVRVVVVMAVLGLAAALGASSVTTWFDQRDQTVEERRLAAELDARIATLEAEVDRRLSPEGARRQALCFGPFVEAGTEVYAVLGVSGCVTSR